VRGYFSTENRAIGLEHVAVLGQLGEIGGAVAASSGLLGEGWRYRVFAGRTSPVWSFSASYERSSPQFVPQMIDPSYRQPRSQIQSSLGLSLGRWGALGASYTAIEQGDGAQAQVLTANYSASLARAGTISAFAMQADGAGMNDLRVGVSWTLALGMRASASLRGDSDGVAMELRGSPPAGPGWGYRLNVERGRRDMALGSVQWRGAAGDAELQVAQTQGQNAARLLANGSFIWSGGQVRAARAMGDAFAVVRVPGRANVRVYRENQEVGRTGADGTLLVTGLMPYQSNRIAIAASDLPITSALEDTSQNVVPRMRGAALVRFRSDVAPSARMRLTMPDGTPLAPGTSLMGGQGDVDMFVGYGGEVFLAQFTPGQRLFAQTPAGVCVVSLPKDVVGVAMRLGPQICQLQGEASHAAPFDPLPGFITAML
jgi:outer membrane usher protein